MAPPPDASQWYRLESVHLPNGPDGAMGDNVGVCMPWQWPDAFAGITAARLWAVMRRFFTKVAQVIEKDAPATAEKLRRASPHWPAPARGSRPRPRPP